MSKKYINTLEFYGFGENNRMVPAIGPSYKVKVSDKDGNIITIEKDDSLYAMVSLSFDNNTGVLSLLDVAHDNSVLAEIEMPNADYIYNCRFDEESNAILFDVKSLYGNETETIELDVESLVELYEAGQGIEIGEKNEETGRKPISVKLAEGEDLLKLTEEGLGLDDKVVTEDELEAAISGKADIDYVDELFESLSGLSGVTEEIEKIKEILGTDETDPNIQEKLDDKADIDELTELDEEIGGLIVSLDELSGKVSTNEESINALEEKVAANEENINSLSGSVNNLEEALAEEVSRATSAETELETKIEDTKDELDAKIETEINDRKTEAIANAEYDSSAKTINFFNINDELIDSIDATDFVKDGMIDSVTIETESDTTYLVIVWNTDAGKDVTRIDIGDLFEADNYYTKSEIDEKVAALQEMDAALVNVDTQQWAVINQNRTDMETVDNQLWAAIGAETTRATEAEQNLSTTLSDEITARQDGDDALQSQLDVEKEERENKDTELQNAIAAEKAARIFAINEVRQTIDTKVAEEVARASEAEANLQSQITAEIQRAQRAEDRIETKYDEDINELRDADRELRQYINDQDAIINHRIDGVVSDLEVEQNTRQTKDLELANDIHDIRMRYATIDYVDTQDIHMKDDAISTSKAYAKAYTDTEIDTLETSLKQYCDDGHAELQEAIDDNTTKINEITNDSNNGVLDVLHAEFHELTDGITEQQMTGLLADMLRRIEALEQRP